MKNFTLFSSRLTISFFLVSSLLLGCTGASSPEKSKPTSEMAANVETPKSTTVSSVQYVFGDHLAVFYRGVLQKFYAIQYKTKPAINLSGEIWIVEAGKTSLKIRENASGNDYIFKFEPREANEFEVFGVTYFEGRDFRKKFLDDDEILNINYISEIGKKSGVSAVPEMLCSCVPENVASDCDQGGKGATQTSVEDAGSLAENDRHSSFAGIVSCGAGYYACIKKLKNN